MVRNSTHARHIERLEKLLQASSDERYAPISADDLAIIEEAEAMIGGPDDHGPPRGDEFTALVISRALERRGRSAKEIADTIAAWTDFRDPGEGHSY